jgi:plastocyanin
MKKTLRIFGLTASLVISFTLLACGQKAQNAGSSNNPPAAAAADDQSASATQVKIDNFSFAPQTLTVTAGTTVTWTNHDDVPHNVVSTDKVFKSKTMDTDEKFSYTFAKPGTYNYYCSIHPRMTATVVVK